MKDFKVNGDVMILMSHTNKIVRRKARLALLTILIGLADRICQKFAKIPVCSLWVLFLRQHRLGEYLQSYRDVGYLNDVDEICCLLRF